MEVEAWRSLRGEIYEVRDMVGGVLVEVGVCCSPMLLGLSTDRGGKSRRDCASGSRWRGLCCNSCL